MENKEFSEIILHCIYCILIHTYNFIFCFKYTFIVNIWIEIQKIIFIFIFLSWLFLSHSQETILINLFCVSIKIIIYLYKSNLTVILWCIEQIYWIIKRLDNSSLDQRLTFCLYNIGTTATVDQSEDILLSFELKKLLWKYLIN